MAKGLDCLIDWLLGQISYSGEEGWYLSELLLAVSHYGDLAGGHGEDGSGEDNARVILRCPFEKKDTAPTYGDFLLALRIWPALVLQPDIRILLGGTLQRRTFDVVLALPEAQERCLRVSEERVWRTIAGHSKDMKRVPQLEWRLLTTIAAAGSQGILQRDVRVITGQDKRSVPKRTDALAEKGYVEKRTVVDRGSKTSRLFLKAFTAHTRAHLAAGSDQHEIKQDPYEKPQEFYTSTLEPVPWTANWKNRSIDSRHFADTYLAIAKAWGVIRTSDMRSKMGVVGKAWPQKPLQKASRFFYSKGVITYVAAVYRDGGKIFKDNIKYMRQPTQDEWDEYLATGKKDSQYVNHRSHQRQPKLSTKGKSGQVVPNVGEASAHVADDDGEEDDGATAKVVSNVLRPASAWVPEKPLLATFYDIIDRASPHGISTPDISSHTVGYAFRRHVYSILQMLSDARLQPPHLQHFQVTSEKIRKKKTASYIFSTKRSGGAGSSEDTGKLAMVPGASGDDKKTAKGPGLIMSPYGFRPFRPETMNQHGETLSELSRIDGLPRHSRKLGRPIQQPTKLQVQDNTREDPSASTEASTQQEAPKPRRGRPPKRRHPGLSTDKSGIEASDTHTSVAMRRTRDTSAIEPKTMADPPECGRPRIQSGQDLAETPEVTPVEEHALGKRRSRHQIETAETADPPESRVGKRRRLNSSVAKAVESSSVSNSNSGTQQSPPGRNQAVQFEARLTTRKEVDPSWLNKKGRPPKSLVLMVCSEKLRKSSPARSSVGVQQELLDTPEPQVRAVQSGDIIRHVSENAIDHNTDKAMVEDEIDIDYDMTDQASQGQMENGVIDQEESPPQNEMRVAPQVLVANHAQEQQSTADLPAVIEQISFSEHNTPDDGEFVADEEEQNSDAGQTALPPVARGRKKSRKQSWRRRRRTDEIHVCPKCGKQLTTKEGMDAHLTKSKSSCNPNYVPPPISESVARPARHVKSARSSKKSLGPRFRLATFASENPADATDVAGAPRGFVTRPYRQHSETSEATQTDREAGDQAITASSPQEERGKGLAEPTYKALSQLDRPAEFIESLTTTSVQENAAGPRLVTPELTAREEQSGEQGTLARVTIEEESVAIIDDTTILHSRDISLPTDASILSPSPGVNKGEEESIPTLVSPEQALSTAVDDVVSGHYLGAPLLSSGPIATAPESESLGPPGPEPESVQGDSDHDANLTGSEVRTASKMPPFVMEDHDALGLTETGLRTYRVCEVVKYLLEHNGGAFPGDKALFYAVATFWLRELADKLWPIPRTVHVAVNKLINEKHLKRVSYSAKSRQGRFVHWQLLVRAELDAYGPDVTLLKEKIKDAHPNIYIPKPFSPSDEEIANLETRGISKPDGLAEDQKRHRSHRRQMNEIVILDAPYYAMEAANDAKMTEPEDETPRRKRHVERELRPKRPHKRLKKSFVEKGGSSDRASGTPRTASYGGQDLRMLSSAFTNQALPYAGGLNFLEPNTQLEDFGVSDNDESDTDETPGPPEGTQSSDGFKSMQLDRVTQPDNEMVNSTKCRFMPVETINDNDGTWPQLQTRILDGSLSIQGWWPRRGFFLLQNLPQNIDEMIGKKASEIKIRGWKDRGLARLELVLDRCREWELSAQAHCLSGLGDTAPDHIFINLGGVAQASDVDKTESRHTPSLVWSPKNQLTPSTIDYDELVETSRGHQYAGIDYPVKPDRGRPIGVSTVSRKGSRPGPKRREGQILPTYKMSRRLTAFPEAASDYIQNGEEAEKHLDTSDEDTKIAVFVILQTLLGGAASSMDWGLAMRLLKLTRATAGKTWLDLRKKRGAYIEKLTEKFQREFLTAYENGELPPLDYENLLDYDWPALVIWTMKLKLNDEVQLPGTREALREEFERTDYAPKFTPSRIGQREGDWRDVYYYPQTSIVMRFEVSSQEHATVGVDHAPLSHITEVVKARSWLRSLCCTEAGCFPPHKVKQKFATLANGDEGRIDELLDKASQKLKFLRVIAHRTKSWQVGQPYKLNGQFLVAVEKNSRLKLFAQAGIFKDQLDECFRRKAMFKVPYGANDGTVMSIFNMQAEGRIGIVPRKVPHIPLGFEPGKYETRKFPRTYYYFDLDLEPTARYLYNDDIEVLKKTRSTKRPGEGAAGELPIWCDFFGQMDDERWLLWLGGAIFATATKGPLTPKALKMAVKPQLELFEAEMLIGYGKKLGIFDEVVSGGGVTTREWWWLAIASQIKDREVVAAREEPRRGVTRRRPRAAAK